MYEHTEQFRTGMIIMSTLTKAYMYTCTCILYCFEGNNNTHYLTTLYKKPMKLVISVYAFEI